MVKVAKGLPNKVKTAAISLLNRIPLLPLLTLLTIRFCRSFLVNPWVVSAEVEVVYVE